MQFWMMKEVKLLASMAYNDKDYAGVVKDFVQGRFKGAGKMITSRIALDDLAVKGFDELVTKKDDHW